VGSLNGEVEWGAAGLALPGQSVSGDRHVVAPTPTGMLLGVVDGLGHGEEGAAAAEACARTLQENCTEPLLPLLGRCHERLHHTRGVTVSLACLDTRVGTLTWVGVGDVAGVWIRLAGGIPRHHLACRGGVVGRTLPPLHATTLPLRPRDLVILATDGLKTGFADEDGIAPQDSCERIAGWLLHRYARGTDDALVLVARYLGGASARRSQEPG